MKYFLVFCLCSIHLHAEFFFTPTMIQSHLNEYSEEEKSLVEKDLEVIWNLCLDGTQNLEKPFYVATAGAPGSRKTTILERFVSQHPEYQGGVYLDPDPRTLKYMIHTYYAKSLTPLSIANAASYDAAIKNAYDKWRGASNYIVLSLFEEAMTLGRSIIYGTTSTGAHIPAFFERLKGKGYQIVLLLCSCPEDLCRDAIEYRNSVVRFYQSSPEDALSKGKLFPQKMSAYFAYGDLLYFYWSDHLITPERLAGIWKKGELEIVDEEAMQLFIAKYESDRNALLKEGTVVPPFDVYLK